jgi:hypothetical protein
MAWEILMNAKLVLTGLLAAASFVAHADVVLPDDDLGLGVLTQSPALFGDVKSTSKKLGLTFSDTFKFDLSGKSDVYGTVGNFVGSISFSKVLIDSQELTLSSSTTGYSFNLANLLAGAHVLTVEGLAPKGVTAYVGGLNASPSAVPEPESLALALAGVAVVGFTARRRRAV